jgi:hypothetical protein
LQRVLVVVGVCAMVASMLSHNFPVMILALAALIAGLWPWSTTSEDELVPYDR